jgi:transcriptional regulator with XRE-family HTH domain
MPKNLALVAARVARNLTQEEAAALVEVTKRTWQRWEDADPPRPQPAQVRSLQDTLGLPVEQLGFPPDRNRFVVEDGRGGHDLEVRFPPIFTAPVHRPGPPASDYSGIWLSRYEYFSSSRGETHVGQHYVVLQQDGSAASVRSLLGSAASAMGMDLIIDGVILTGTWVEDTDKTGYYRGRRYVGGIQLVADPSGARLAGKWVGHGKDGEVNTGPWCLNYQAAVTKANIAEYDRLPND